MNTSPDEAQTVVAEAVYDILAEDSEAFVVERNTQGRYRVREKGNIIPQSNLTPEETIRYLVHVLQGHLAREAKMAKTTPKPRTRARKTPR